jgi:hypothetical protein
MAEVRRYISSNDFGVITRGPDDEAVCRAGGAFQHVEKCKIIDDVVIYLGSGMVSGQSIDRIDQMAAASPINFDQAPPGRLPEFYRALVAIRLYNKYAGSPPTLNQVLIVLDITNDTRDRNDDYANIDTAVRAVLGYPLTATEQAWAADRLRAINAAGVDVSDVKKSPITNVGTDEKPPRIDPPPKTAAGGAGVGAALALSVGGFVVGGPVGAGVGFIVGLLAGKK